MAGETILAIDDRPTVRKLMEMILSTEGYRIITAADGMEGIAKAKVEKPAVVLVDFVMPKMNGFQVCKAIKETANLKDTPIILVTSKGETVGSKFVDLLGIREYFTKPFQPEELLARYGGEIVFHMQMDSKVMGDYAYLLLTETQERRKEILAAGSELRG